MIFQSLMGPRKSRCDVTNGTTQEWACPLLRFYHVISKKRSLYKNPCLETYRAFRKILEELNVTFFFFEPKHSKKRSKVEVGNINYAPFTYILINNQLEVGKILISCDWSQACPSF